VEKMISAKAKRGVLKGIVSLLSLFRLLPENDTPKEYKTFVGGNIPEKIRQSLVEAYIQIFSEPPWYENWEAEQVKEKIEKDLSSPTSFLVLFIEKGVVGGFVWGNIINGSNVLKRAAAAMNVKEEEITIHLGNENVLYCDEFAILRSARRGITTVRLLLRETLAYGINNNAPNCIFWSTPQSRIVPLANTMGYEERGKTKMRDKDIKFFYLPTSVFLYKMTFLDERISRAMMSLVSKNKSKNRSD